MDKEIARILVEATARFYAVNAVDFSATRQSAWAGWEQLAQFAAGLFSGAQQPVRVADVACGNGRFLKFLQQRFPAAPIEYVGWDGNGALLSEAAATLADGVAVLVENTEEGQGGSRSSASSPAVQSMFKQVDLLAPLLREAPYNFQSPSDGAGLDAGPWGTCAAAAPFDLVGCFGFLHHIPGTENRIRFLRQLLQLAAPGGLVAVSLWRFADYGPLREKARRSTAAASAALCDLSIVDGLEPGDYLLGWGSESAAMPASGSAELDQVSPLAFRYCHSFSDDEADRLAAAIADDGALVGNFFADGRTGALNQYLVFRRAD